MSPLPRSARRRTGHRPGWLLVGASLAAAAAVVAGCAQPPAEEPASETPDHGAEAAQGSLPHPDDLRHQNGSPDGERPQGPERAVREALGDEAPPASSEDPSSREEPDADTSEEPDPDVTEEPAEEANGEVADALSGRVIALDPGHKAGTSTHLTRSTNPSTRVPRRSPATHRERSRRMATGSRPSTSNSPSTCARNSSSVVPWSR